MQRYVHMPFPQNQVSYGEQLGGRSSMAERRTVDANVVGSSPIAHPLFSLGLEV